EAGRARRSRPVGAAPEEPARSSRQVGGGARGLGLLHRRRQGHLSNLHRPQRSPRLRAPRRRADLLVADARRNRPHRRRARTGAGGRPPLAALSRRARQRRDQSTRRGVGWGPQRAATAEPAHAVSSITSGTIATSAATNSQGNGRSRVLSLVAPTTNQA